MTFYRWLPLLAMICLVSGGCTAAGPAAAPAATPPTSATAGATTIVAVQPAAAPASPPCTIWQFLGVPGAAKGVCGVVSCIQNRLGTLFPGLEAKPAMLAITDPANMNSSNPAVSAAAGAKADEDAAPQKVKAINYLGTIGCGGCYPDVQDALLAALDDCTEGVRFAAVNALRGTACGQCKVCRKKACCSPKVMEKLYKVANDVDDTGCYKEPSPRVRRMARLAMAACGGGVPAPTSTPLEGPAEGPPASPPATPPAPASPVVRAAAPPTRVAARAPVAVAAASPRPKAKPAQQTTQPAVQTAQPAVPPVASPPGDSSPASSDVEKPEQAEQSDPSAALPTAAASVSSRSQSAAEAPAAQPETPAPTAEPAATQGEEPDQPARSRPAPAGPAAVKEPLPSVVQAAAETSSAPLAAATGIELMQPSFDAGTAPATTAEQPVAVQTPSATAPTTEQQVAQQAERIVEQRPVNPPSARTWSAPAVRPAVPSKQALPIVVNNQIRSASPASQPQAGPAANSASPAAMSQRAQAAASPQRQGSGPLMIFQSQTAANRANVIRNPFVDETGEAGKKQIALASGNQALPGDRGSVTPTTQLANWQVEASRPGGVQTPQAAAAPPVGISDEQLLAYYRQNAGNYRGPNEVRWLWIHVRFDSFGTRPDAYAAGAALRQAAVEGQIAEAVRKYPQTEVRSFDWTPANQLPSRAMAKALLQMRAGEVSVMMASASGVEIVQLLEARPTTLSFEQVRERVRQDLLNQSPR